MNSPKFICGLEDLWRNRLTDAELRLTSTRHDFHEVQRDLRTGSNIHGRNRDDTYQHALRAKNLALAEYNRVFKIFSDLVLHDKIPDEGR